MEYGQHHISILLLSTYQSRILNAKLTCLASCMPLSLSAFLVLFFILLALARSLFKSVLLSFSPAPLPKYCAAFLFKLPGRLPGFAGCVKSSVSCSNSSIRVSIVCCCSFRSLCRIVLCLLVLDPLLRRWLTRWSV